MNRRPYRRNLALKISIVNLAGVTPRVIGGKRTRTKMVLVYGGSRETNMETSDGGQNFKVLIMQKISSNMIGFTISYNKSAYKHL